MNEFCCLAKLGRHENIVEFYGASIHGRLNCPPRFVIHLEYLQHTLEDYLRDPGNPTFRSIKPLNIIKGLVAGLAHCHNLGIAHRDISPPNILLTSSGVKYADFGLSKDLGSNHNCEPWDLCDQMPANSSWHCSPWNQDSPLKVDLTALAAVVFEVLGVAVLKENVLELRKAGHKSPPHSFCTEYGKLKDSILAIVIEMIEIIQAAPVPASERCAAKLNLLLDYITGLLVNPPTQTTAQEFEMVVVRFVAGTEPDFSDILEAVP